MQNIRWKIITIVVVFVVFAAVGVYPIIAARYGIHSPGWLMDKQLKLGLDLKGGVHLVLRVQTDDALKALTDSESERLREELTKRGIPVTSITVTDPAHFKVEGVPTEKDAEFRQTAAEEGAEGQAAHEGGDDGAHRVDRDPEGQREEPHPGDLIDETAGARKDEDQR